jgi:hypothetical protein
MVSMAAQVLAPFVLFHNALLSAVSLVLLVALTAELARELLASPGDAGAKLWAVWCDPPPRQFTAGRLYFIYYVNYLVKVRHTTRRNARRTAMEKLRIAKVWHLVVENGY